MQRMMSRRMKAWVSGLLVLGLALAGQDRVEAQSERRTQGEGPAPAVHAVESAPGDGQFRASRDKEALTPAHPPLDQIPPMRMPAFDENALQRAASGPGNGISYDARNRRSTTSEASFAAASQAFAAGGGYDGADGAQGDEARPASMNGSMSIIGNPGRADFPWRMNVKVVIRWGSDYFVCSGTMRDAATVLTAGHCVFDFGGPGWADEIWVYPAWDGNGAIIPAPTIANHYGWAHSTILGSWTGWTNSGDLNYDIGLVALDRPVGMLTGWFGWAWGFDCGFWTSTTVNNAAYPAEGCGSPGLHNGRDMTYWSGTFDSCPTFNRLRLNTVPGCYNAIWGGMSGSGVYYIDGTSRFVHGITSTSNRSTLADYTRQFESWVNYSENDFIPTYGRGAAFDVAPLDMNGGPAVIPAGGSTTSLTHLAVNRSNAAANNTWTFRVYLSTNDNIDAGDTLLSTQSYGWSFGAVSSVTVNMAPVTIPANTPPGNYYLGVIYDNATDGNASNNDSDGWDALPVRVTKPDLDVTAFSGPASAKPGESFTVSNTVQNVGNAVAGASRLGLYLSDDSLCTTGDTLIGRRAVGALAPGASSAASTLATLPAGAALGAKFLCGIADDLSAVVESNEGNNTAFSALTVVQADLDITAVSGPVSASPGATFNVANTVLNGGTAAAGAFRVGLYLSDDNVCTTSDTFLASRNLASLGIGASSAANTPVTLPAATPLAVRYLCAIADDLAAVTESSESNNTGAAVLNVISAKPVITLKVNGQDLPVVNTTGAYLLTLDVSPSTYAASVDWYWALVVNGTVSWVTSAGVQASPAPLLSVPPATLTNVSLLNATLPVGTNITSVFFMLNGGTVVAVDSISTTVIP